MRKWLFLTLSVVLLGCETQAGQPDAVNETVRPVVPEAPAGANVRTAGFVITDQVFNSELMAPYDVFQHSVFRDEADYIQTFVVSADGEPVETFEGILVTPHYSFDDAPPIDILVIPSTGGSMTVDLENTQYMEFISAAVAQAEWVITVCDGAFPLAATGVLNGRVATTFPGDREAFQERFPQVDVRFDQRIVVDDKYITSVGGAMSYEPAFYLVERLYGKAHADLTAQGLVWPWDIADVPVLEVQPELTAGE